MKHRCCSNLSLVILLHWFLVGSAFSPIQAPTTLAKQWSTFLAAESDPDQPVDKPDFAQNETYIQGLINNLTVALDRWIITGSPVKKTQVQNILYQIKRESKSDALILAATRLAKRAGFPTEEDKELGKTDSDARRQGVVARKEWEEFRESVEQVGQMVGRTKHDSRSALSSRLQANGKRDLFMGDIDDRLVPDDNNGREDVKEEPLVNGKTLSNIKGPDVSFKGTRNYLQLDKDALERAQLRTSEMVAKSGTFFDGELLGIGGLDEVLAQVKRRIWIPLAAPPVLLQQLGITPVRGLLLYGMPGCGKTLIARTIGRILSPVRPITVVSGPELMDKFVGSSEQNVRKVFDEPPPIYDYIRANEADDGKAISAVALHVIIMDEFDAMARTRGGKLGAGAQGDAGVARDSVVNQILAKMDGVDPLPVPTLVIGMTNKRSLIDSALLRPGRFEVQIEVPPPRTQAQRVSILKVHTKTMFEAGRLLVRDAPKGPAADRQRMIINEGDLPNYEELLNQVAKDCEGFSGASLAGVARAAASHALERSVNGFSTSSAGGTNGESMLDCLVTKEDLQLAVSDVNASSGDSDWAATSDEEPLITET